MGRCKKNQARKKKLQTNKQNRVPITQNLQFSSLLVNSSLANQDLFDTQRLAQAFMPSL